MAVRLELQELQQENEELRATLEKLYGELSMRDEGPMRDSRLDTSRGLFASDNSVTGVEMHASRQLEVPQGRDV